MSEVDNVVRAEEFDSFLPYSKEVIARSNDDGDEFDALWVPHSVKGKTSFSMRLAKLLEVEWKSRESKLVSGVVAYQGESILSYPNAERPASDFIFIEDLAAIMSALIAVLPNPDDENFARAIRGRMDGTFIAMSLLASLHANVRDTGLVAREATVLGKAEMVGADYNRLPKDFSHNIRKDVMKDRVRRIRQLSEEFPEQEREYFRLKTLLFRIKIQESTKKHLRDIIATYDERISEMTKEIVVMAPEVITVQWGNVLLNKLRRLTESFRTTEGVLDEVLVKCKEDLENAPNHNQFTSIINKLA